MQTVDRYIGRLASEHAHDRDEALAWLCDHPQESHSPLVELVKVGKPDQHTLGAIYLLGRMGWETDVALLTEVLERTDPQLLWESAQALGHHASPGALLALLKELQHHNASVVGAAAFALGMRGDEAARKPLERLLDHKDETVRYQAILVLRRLNIASSADVLRAHLDQENSSQVKQIIHEALGESNDEAGGGASAEGNGQ